MTTEIDTTIAQAPTVVHPVTGEIVDLTDARGPDLADLLEQVSGLYDVLRRFKDGVVGEVARRADGRAERTTTIDGVKFEVNAPTEDVYEVEDVEAELGRLVETGHIDQELVDSVIVTPPPKPPAKRVDKRRINALLKTDDRTLLAALHAARRREVKTRTAKVLDRPINSTAEEA